MNMIFTITPPKSRSHKMQNPEMNNLLEEIFAVPSPTVIENHFAADSTAAACNGECSGPQGCRG
jgi:hypothetical protein